MTEREKIEFSGVKRTDTQQLKTKQKQEQQQQQNVSGSSCGVFSNCFLYTRYFVCFSFLFFCKIFFNGHLFSLRFPASWHSSRIKLVDWFVGLIKLL